MDLNLRGSVALVTGGASGIGAAIARRFGEEGCSVAIVDCRALDDSAGARDALEALGVTARAYQTDVRDHAASRGTVAAVLDDFGRLDVLVCSAGITSDALTWRMTEAQWDDVIDVNLKGCFNYLHAVSPHFRERKRGRIVNVASINGLRGKHGQANYAASKGGMIALTKTLARELGRFNVTVNAVAPGMVETPMAQRLPADVIARATDETVVGRLARPEDCADMVVFLCSPRAAHITGEVIRVDGGQAM